MVAPGFIGKDMTIRNTAGAAGEQAVALRAGGDQQAFSNVNLEGYQVLQLVSNFETQTIQSVLLFNLDCKSFLITEIAIFTIYLQNLLNLN